MANYLPEDPGWNRLATYNTECHRGIVHTAEYDAEMAVLQRRFDQLHAPPSGIPSGPGLLVLPSPPRPRWWRFKR